MRYFLLLFNTDRVPTLPDNGIGEEGAKALAAALPHTTVLTVLNVGGTFAGVLFRVHLHFVFTHL